MRSIAILAALMLVPVGQRAGAESLVPVEQFAQIPMAATARMSPDGSRVALISSYKGRQVLYVHAIVEGEKNSKIIQLGDYQVRWVRWKDNRHLVAGVFTETERIFSNQAPAEYEVTRLMAFDANGDNIMMIGEPPGGFNQKVTVTGSAVEHRKVHPQIQDTVVSMMPQSPTEIMQSVIDEIPFRDQRNAPALYSVDLATGKHQRVYGPDPRILHYVVDRDGQVRLANGLDGLDRVFYVRSGPDNPWREVRRVKLSGDELFAPLAFMPDNPHALYVLSNRGSDGRPGLWSFDADSKQFVQMIDDQANITISPSTREGTLISYTLQDGTLRYIDPAWQSDYVSVSRAVKGKKLRIVDRTEDGAKVLLEMHEPHHPRVWWVLDRTVKPINLWPAVESYPNLTEDGHIYPVREVTYAARDGLQIPAYVTLPDGYKGGPIPFVVLPHGGPYTCDGNDFDYESQFLASRGWGVLRPQFRGSACYGRDFENRGYREWGFAMQDDVTDGTLWLIEQKYADPSRICIVGSNYGGYAALQGAAKEPDLYRCAAAWAPVSDLISLSRSWKERLSPQVLLDRLGNDDDRLDAGSPARHADRIKIPVLLVHGRQDGAVKVGQSQEMENALRSAGKPVEAIYLDNADHYREQYEARFAWLSALDRFIGAQLGRP